MAKKKVKQELVALEEKYRPKSMDEFIDDEDRSKVKKINRILNAGIFKHFLFHGPAGTGKTTMAGILAKLWLEKYSDKYNPRSVKWFNASDDRGIDVVRNKIKSLVTTQGSYVIILDEADAMTDDAQTALRRLMEQAKKSSSPKLFILTCNYPEKIIEPIHSRCEDIEFDKILPNLMIERLEEIVMKENVKKFIFSDNVVTAEERKIAITTFFEYVYSETNGDMRSSISMVQEFIYYDKTAKVMVLDLNLKDKVRAKMKTKISMILEQIFSSENPTFENIVAYVEEIKKNNIFINKVLRDINMWIAGHSANPKKNDAKGIIKLGVLTSYHMGVTVAKYDARIRNKSDYLVQMSALFMELSLIYLTNYLPDTE